MRRRVSALVCVALMIIVPSALGQERPAETGSNYVPVTAYDPSRNAAHDIQNAIAETHRTGKRILLEIGGNWCGWCHTMDKFFEQNPKLLALREENFVLVKVNFSKENKNEMLLANYPHIPGYPHLFVLDSEGKLLHSQDTSQLELGKSYDLKKFTAFLKKWGRRP